MKLIPDIVRNLHRLSWKEGLGVDDYQRVRLRLMLMPLVVAGLAVIVVALYMGLVMLAGKSSVLDTVTMVALVVAMLFSLVLGLWIFVMTIKTDIMRLRALGFGGAGLVGMFLLATVLLASVNAGRELASSPELLLTGVVPLWLYRMLGYTVFAQIGSALFDFWMYFEEAPLRKPVVPLAQAYAKPAGPFERVLLILLQAFIWFGILSFPVFFIVNIML